MSPFLWDRESVEYNGIFEESKQYAILHGVCFVVHSHESGFSVLSICNKNDDGNFFKKLIKNENKIQMLLLKCFEEDIKSNAEECCNIKLTLREREVLKWLALGKTYCEISMICGISERTVRFHMMNLLKKLDANNTKYALTKAADYGLIEK
ncbi:LuxR C-terminal-related transcriptional regulator [Brenneria populi subsp. brevivirga]|uniref:helix-turn-helix transcriptional regulator n=1 Tax=Brenneria populi TaxID=1505588 RepID=UPI002E16DF1B|nr:LuxR C-terminal-related transcriptional regulator [Brenneria populi subsp. brevivirga]